MKCLPKMRESNFSYVPHCDSAEAKKEGGWVQSIVDWVNFKNDVWVPLRFSLYEGVQGIESKN